MKKKKFSIFNANFNEKLKKKQSRIMNKFLVLGIISIIAGFLLLILGFFLLLTKLSFVIITILLAFSLANIIVGFILIQMCRYFHPGLGW